MPIVHMNNIQFPKSPHFYCLGHCGTKNGELNIIRKECFFSIIVVYMPYFPSGNFRVMYYVMM